MPSFNYICPDCKAEWLDIVPSSESPSSCKCGGRGERQFTPTRNILIPAWMKAGGEDSEHSRWVKSDKVQQGLKDGTYAPMSEVVSGHV